jgi:hypothetical protein
MRMPTKVLNPRTRNRPKLQQIIQYRAFEDLGEGSNEGVYYGDCIEVNEVWYCNDIKVVDINLEPEFLQPYAFSYGVPSSLDEDGEIEYEESGIDCILVETYLKERYPKARIVSGGV